MNLLDFLVKHVFPVYRDLENIKAFLRGRRMTGTMRNTHKEAVSLYSGYKQSLYYIVMAVAANPQTAPAVAAQLDKLKLKFVPKHKHHDLLVDEVWTFLNASPRMLALERIGEILEMERANRSYLVPIKGRKRMSSWVTAMGAKSSAPLHLASLGRRLTWWVTLVYITPAQAKTGTSSSENLAYELYSKLGAYIKPRKKAAANDETSADVAPATTEAQASTSTADEPTSQSTPDYSDIDVQFNRKTGGLTVVAQYRASEALPAEFVVKLRALGFFNAVTRRRAVKAGEVPAELLEACEDNSKSQSVPAELLSGTIAELRAWRAALAAQALKHQDYVNTLWRERRMVHLNHELNLGVLGVEDLEIVAELVAERISRARGN